MSSSRSMSTCSTSMSTCSTSPSPRNSLADIKPLPRPSSPELPLFVPIYRAKLADLHKQWCDLKTEGEAMIKHYYEHTEGNMNWKRAGSEECVELVRERGKLEREIYLIETRMAGIDGEYKAMLKEANAVARGHHRALKAEKRGA